MTVTPEDVRATAFRAHDLGFAVIPVREDGSKRPDLDAWTHFQQVRPTKAQVESWFRQTRYGVGILTGTVSGNIDCVEFDDVDTYETLKRHAPAAGMDELVNRIEDGYCERTPGGGVHWLFRCDEVAGNQKLARRAKRPEEKNHDNDNIQVLIETRGEGGFLVVAPSHGPVHKTGRAYEVLSGDLETIAMLSMAEVKALKAYCATFDLLGDERKKGDDVPRAERRSEERDGRPGDDYNARANWEDILAPHGWQKLYTRGETTFWCRPGKKGEISASTNYHGSDLFYPWSSSTEFEQNRGYSKFAVYAKLEHRDNYADAAKRLAANGYGERGKYIDEEQANLIATFPRTEIGNAQLFAHLFGGKIVYDWEREKYFIWQRHRWSPDPDGERHRMAMLVSKAWQQAAAAMEAGPERTEFFKWGVRCENRAKRETMLHDIQSHPAIKNAGRRWDMNPHLIGVNNGVVDLQTGALLPGQPSDLITMTADIVYDPKAACPRWEQFLHEVFEDKEDVIEYIRRAVGYSLTGWTREQVMFICHGKGSNGKSVFLSILRALAGEYATNIASDTIKKKHGGNDNHPAEIAALVGKRVVTCNETPEAAGLNDERVKGLTDGSLQTARFMRGNPFTFKPVLKLWLATNHLPRIDDDSDGLWRRMRLVPFNRQFKGADRDNHLEDKLMAELPGIFAWAVRGAKSWYEHGLEAPLSVMMATLEYRNASDPLAQFMTERCVIAPLAQSFVGEIYKAYVQWAEAQGMRPTEMLGASVFGRRMAENYERGTKHGGIRYYKGIRVRYPDEGVSASAEADTEADDFGVWNSAEAPEAPELETSLSVQKWQNAIGETGNGPTSASVPPPALRCLCRGRHENKTNLCANAKWWRNTDDTNDGTWHCTQCHQPPISGEE